MAEPTQPTEPGAPLRVAMVGCGAISRKYLATTALLAGVDIVVAADVLADKAQAVADVHPGIRASTPEQAMAADDVDIVLNLTVPAAHARVSAAALSAGKHVYGEKPLATSVAAGRELLEAAQASGRVVGCAPDTVLGAGLQTARAALDRGDIGRPLAATAVMAGPGPDDTQPNPAFFYQPGAGPLFDMGPYYLTALVSLLGPVQRVVAMGRASSARRRVARGPNTGMMIEVAVPTHVSAVLEHSGGALSSMTTSWDARGGTTSPRLEVFGDGGTLLVPDPNTFDGEVLARSHPTDDWLPITHCAGYHGLERGVGLDDLGRRLTAGLPPRASGALGLHVLDVMESIASAAHSGQAVPVSSTVPRPDPLPLITASDVA